jgi:hypothetical protein
MAAAFERELDALYQLPLDRFTAARNELANRLGAAGQTEAAQQVKALRKPTAAVWLVNRLAREDELEIQRLLKAGESMTKTQAKVARGQSPEGFLEARREEQQALERLARAARKLADREGVGSSSIVRATQTLRAAALTEEGRKLLKRGRLTEELQPPGFEALTGLTFAPRPHAQADTTDGQRGTLKEAGESLRELRTQEREFRAAARSAAREADRAEAEAQQLREHADATQSEADQASRRVEAAEAELERMRQRP